MNLQSWCGSQRVSLPCMPSTHAISRRSLPVILALGATVTMVASANAANNTLEGQDTSKGGEAPGADLRCVKAYKVLQAYSFF